MIILISSFVDIINLEFLWLYLPKLAIAIAIIALTWLITKIFERLISRTLGFLSPQVTLQLKRITSASIWIVGITQALNQLGLDHDLLLLIIVIVGLTAITACRDILPNLIAFNVIKTYELYRIGDWIELDGYFGRVVKINLMNTLLLSRNNEMSYIPNSKFMKSNLINKTVRGGIRIAVPLTVNRCMNLSKVEKILLEVSEELRESLAPNFLPEVRVCKLDEYSVKVELLLMISNPASDAFITSEVLKKTLRKLENIK